MRSPDGEPLIPEREADRLARMLAAACFAMGVAFGGCAEEVRTRWRAQAEREAEAAIRAEGRREGRAEVAEALRAGGVK